MLFDRIADHLAPQRPRVNPSVVASISPLMNRLRKARGEKELTLAEAEAAPYDPVGVARKLEIARIAMQAEEARLRAGEL
jgi:hypothetical protein